MIYQKTDKQKSACQKKKRPVQKKDKQKVRVRKNDLSKKKHKQKSAFQKKPPVQKKDKQKSACQKKTKLVVYKETRNTDYFSCCPTKDKQTLFFLIISSK